MKKEEHKELSVKDKILLTLKEKPGQKAREISSSLEVEKKEIKAFVDRVENSIKDLSFKSRQEIVRVLVEKVVGNHGKLTISGYIPITNINVFTINRNCRAAERGEIHSF
ncbi:MAG TPA: hypothetical protein QGH03_01895 [Candidatus Paceibacterota bacterium]|nr:hypothetical protein [Candidatus Paceibacterota bacterium]HJN62963.1 hypothetical protein [Candidatus Paceibacterota bacterium]